MLVNFGSGSGLQIAQGFIQCMSSGGEGIGNLIHQDGLMQHNPTIGDGASGLMAALDSCCGRYPKFEVLMAFEAEPYVVMICTREVSSLHLGIEVFRIKDGKISAHWDNYCHTHARLLDALKVGIDELGRVAKGIIDPLSQLAASRIVSGFLNEVLVGRDLATDWHLSPVGYKEWKWDAGLFLNRPREKFMRDYGFESPFKYRRVQKIITDGRFALAAIEGDAAGHPTCHFEFFAIDRLGVYFRIPIDELIVLSEFRRSTHGKLSFPD